MTAANRAVLGTPGVVRVGGREFVVPQPTAGDEARVYEAMRDVAAKACVSPLSYVNANAEGMAPGVLAEALRVAVAMGSGGGVEPTREAVQRAYSSLDGVRFQLWYYARKAEPKLTRQEVADLVGEDDRYDVLDALAAAQPRGAQGDPKAPSGGAS